MNEIRGKGRENTKEVKIYEEEKALEGEEAARVCINIWKKIYNSSLNEIGEVWGEKIKKELIEKFEEEDGNREGWLREHIDMARRVEEEIRPMRLPELNNDTLGELLRKMKNNKASGPDKLKGELFKELGKSEVCRKTMVKCYNNVLNEVKAPTSWTISKTIMIKKKRKPTARDFRPIALLNISCKVYMSFIRDEIENHLKVNYLGRENQMGFTKGARPEYSHFILQYIIDMTIGPEEKKPKKKKGFRRKRKKKGKKPEKEIILIALDFKKAFDSVNRKSLIETMIKYKVNPYVIDLIAKLYENDSTLISMGGIEEEIAISAGIRQGCTASTAFFKLVTFEIMRKLEEEGENFMIDDISMNSLFYADDSIILVRSLEAAKRNLDKIEKISKEYGLIINHEKSKILMYSKKKISQEERITNFEGIEVVRNVKYLGIQICDEADIFKTHKEEVIKKAKEMANKTYWTISRCCNRVMMGKLYWKNIIIPSVLQCMGVLSFNIEEINKLQVIDYSVYRMILGGASFTPNAALRGEIGTSLMKTREIESKLLLTKSILEGENKLLQEILEKVRNKGNSKWNKHLVKCLRRANMSWGDVGRLSKEQIRSRVRKIDTVEWEEELDKKVTLEMYRNYKREMREEGIYDNRFSSKLLFKARTDCLDLNEGPRSRSDINPRRDISCTLCGAERENQEHFILNCRKLKHKRNNKLIEEKKGVTDKETLGNLLFIYNGEDLEDLKEMLQGMWSERSRQLKQKAAERERGNNMPHPPHPLTQTHTGTNTHTHTTTQAHTPPHSQSDT